MPAIARTSVTPDEALRVRNLRDKVFMTDAMPTWAAWTAYICLAAVSIGVTPQIWPGVKVWSLSLYLKQLMHIAKGRLNGKLPGVGLHQLQSMTCCEHRAVPVRDVRTS